MNWQVQFVNQINVSRAIVATFTTDEAGQMSAPSYLFEDEKLNAMISSGLAFVSKHVREHPDFRGQPLELNQRNIDAWQLRFVPENQPDFWMDIEQQDKPF